MTKRTLRHKSRRLRRFLKANEAVSALEYAVLVGVISVALIGIFGTFTDEIEDAIEKIGTNVKSNMGSVGTSPF